MMFGGRTNSMMMSAAVMGWRATAMPGLGAMASMQYQPKQQSMLMSAHTNFSFASRLAEKRLYVKKRTIVMPSREDV